ncbi:MAG: WG repeat-containing protein, partial [Catalinimonas sp.]
ATPLGPGRYAYRTGDRYGLMSADGSRLTEAIYDSIYPFQADKAIVRQDSLYGVINAGGRVMLPVRHTYAHTDPGGYFRLRETNGTGRSGYALYDSLGNQILPPLYEALGTFSQGLCAVKVRGRWGYVDPKGLMAVEPRFDSAGAFVTAGGHAYAPAWVLGKMGLIDRRGDWYVRPQYEALRPVPDRPDRFVAVSRHHQRLIDTDGLFRHQADTLEPRAGGYVWVRKGGHWGVIGPKDRMLIKPAYDTIVSLGNYELFTVRTGDRWGLLDAGGGVLMAPDDRYRAMLTLTEGLVGVHIDRGWGFVDDRGRLLIANRYEEVRPFSEARAAVVISGNWGYIDLSERLVVQPYYEAAGPFRRGLARVRRDGRWGFIDPAGQVVLPLTSDTIRPTGNGNFINREGDFWGLVSADARQIVPPKYDALTELPNGDVLVRRGDVYGVFDATGRPTVPPIFNWLYYNRYDDTYLTAEYLPTRLVEVP